MVNAPHTLPNLRDPHLAEAFYAQLEWEITEAYRDLNAGQQLLVFYDTPAASASRWSTSGSRTSTSSTYSVATSRAVKRRHRAYERGATDLQDCGGGIRPGQEDRLARCPRHNESDPTHRVDRLAPCAYRSSSCRPA